MGGAYYSYPELTWRGLPHNGLQAGIGVEMRFQQYTNVFTEWRYMSIGAGGLAPITVGMRF